MYVQKVSSEYKSGEKNEKCAYVIFYTPYEMVLVDLPHLSTNSLVTTSFTSSTYMVMNNR